MMEHRIDMLRERKLVAMRLTMSLVNNRTGELWKNFMLRAKEINNVAGKDRYSIQYYPADYFKNFDPAKTFEKLAAVEVEAYHDLPSETEAFILPAGKYAVFHYKAAEATAEESFRYIFQTWLPSSGFELDHRPHFEILGEKYKKDDPSSEEEIWIPIKSN